MDQVDDDRVCGAAGADRGNGLLPTHAHAGGVARTAGLGGSADAAVGGWDDRGRLDHPAGDSRSGSRGGALPWALLVVGSVASLAANVALAEPTETGRVIAAWPTFALIAAYELLMRQVRHSATGSAGVRESSSRPRPAGPTVVGGPVRGPVQTLAGP